MVVEVDTELLQAASDLRVAIGRVVRRLRQGHVVGEATLAEASVLARLDRDGAATPGCLAELERVRPQAMGVTLAALSERGLVARDADPTDRRRVVMSVTADGRRLLADRRSRSASSVAQALADFPVDDRDRLLAAIPLLERLADRL